MIKQTVHALDSSFGRIYEMSRNMIESAMKLGLSPTKPIKLRMLGASPRDGWYGFEIRYAIISYSQPIPSNVEIDLWINPVNRRMFKNTLDTGEWIPILTYKDVFIEQILVRNTPSSGTGSSITGQPLQSISDLVALNTTTIPDKSVYYVEDERSLYALDLQGNDPTTPPSVYRPTTGPGAWYLITSHNAIGNIDGGIYQ
jgi:hypothetical protein